MTLFLFLSLCICNLQCVFLFDVETSPPIISADFMIFLIFCLLHCCHDHCCCCCGTFLFNSLQRPHDMWVCSCLSALHVKGLLYSYYLLFLLISLLWMPTWPSSCIATHTPLPHYPGGLPHLVLGVQAVEGVGSQLVPLLTLEESLLKCGSNVSWWAPGHLAYAALIHDKHYLRILDVMSGQCVLQDDSCQLLPGQRSHTLYFETQPVLVTTAPSFSVVSQFLVHLGPSVPAKRACPSAANLMPRMLSELLLLLVFYLMYASNQHPLCLWLPSPGSAPLALCRLLPNACILFSFVAKASVVPLTHMFLQDSQLNLLTHMFLQHCAESLQLGHVAYVRMMV